MRKKKLLGWTALVGGAAVLAIVAPQPEEPAALAAAEPAKATNPSKPSREPRLLARLPERDALGHRRGELFASQSWTPAPAARKPARETAPAVAAPPAPPPIPYRVAGKVVYEGGAHVVLAKGDRVYTVREGDTLEHLYRVASISPKGVVLVYLPMGIEQSLPVNIALEADLPAGDLEPAGALRAAAARLRR